MSLEDYEPVAVRLDRWIHNETQQGHIPRVLTSLLSAPGADVCVFRAELWRIVQLADGAGERAILLASGHAEEVRGANNINRVSHLEACETSALGRALANWGLAGSDWTKRASREEMTKVERMTTTSNGPSASGIKAYGTVRHNGGSALREGSLPGSASEKQIGYIKGACKRDGIPAPIWVNDLSKQEASNWIEGHKNGLPAQQCNRDFQPVGVLSEQPEEDPF